MNYTPEKCKKIFQLTEQFLFKMIYDVVKDCKQVREILSHYQKPRDKYTMTLPEIYEHFCKHAHNKANVNGNSIKIVFVKDGKWERLRKFLGNFNPVYVRDTFKNAEDLESKIRVEFDIKDDDFNKPAQGFVVTLFQLSQFFAQLHDEQRNVYKYFDDNGNTEKPTKLLNYLLDKKDDNNQKIFFGFGKALLPDALKEMGYTEHAKPDIHIKDITRGLIFNNKQVGDDETIDAVKEFAQNAGITPYLLDKYFYLIGSGNFYHHLEISDKMSSDTVGRKQNFIAFVKERLREDLEINKQVALLVNDEINGLYRGQMGIINEIDYENWRVKIRFPNRNNLLEEFYPSDFVILTE